MTTTTETSTNTVIFTARDVDHLVRRFSIPELRHEIHSAEVQSSVARTFGEDDQEWWFEDFADACKMAIEILQSQQPKPTPGQLRNFVDVAEMKSHIDITDIIGRHMELRKAGRRFVGCCPIHGEQHPSLTVYADEGRWYCFGCNRGGDVIAFVMAVEQCDFKGAVTILGGER